MEKKLRVRCKFHVELILDIPFDEDLEEDQAEDVAEELAGKTLLTAYGWEGDTVGLDERYLEEDHGYEFVELDYDTYPIEAKVVKIITVQDEEE